ncbi:MAG: CapA family protein [Oscillospiraceae bacterium]|jgi:poly-gamma-glutamate synthesis protein (capsule biosynthesis protein)|nr:CapA family protein [Oscillospiraceae bacterium]
MAGIILGLVGETNVNRPNPETAFDDVRDMLGKADALIGHLESPVHDSPSTNKDMPDLAYKKDWGLSTPDSILAWKSMGFDALGTASNVSGNPESIVCTVKALDEAGIAHAGTGENITAARRPAIFEKKGMKFGLLSYTSVYYPMYVPALAQKPGAATVKAEMSIIPSPRSIEMPGVPPRVTTWLDPAEKAEMLDDVKKLREQVDFVILSCHWGVTDSTETLEYQKEFARAAIDAGADCVMGHHPHRPQGVEFYKEKPIFYSMGNFAFDWWFIRHWDKKGMVAFLTLDGRNVTKVRVVPCFRREDNQIAPAPFDSKEGGEIIESVRTLSEAMGTELNLVDGELILTAKQL